MATAAFAIAAMTVSCDPDVDTVPASFTRSPLVPLDCVAILGMIPGATALEALPYSGVPRGKRVSELTDVELARSCDFTACLGANGYRRACRGYPGIADIPFVLEANPLVEEALDTCYPDTSDGRLDLTAGDTATCIAGARAYYNNCPNDLGEDCLREKAASDTARWPTCDRIRSECPL